jgi:hypothetical protein
MKKIFAILLVALMVLGFSMTFATTSNSFIDGNVRQIGARQAASIYTTNNN